MDDYYIDEDFLLDFNDSEANDSSVLTQIEYIIQRVVPPFLITIGTIGNVLCAVTFFKLSLGKHPSSLFLMLLCILDTARLLIETGNQWMASLSINATSLNTQIMKSDLNCKVFTFLEQVIHGLDNWIVVILMSEMVYMLRDPSHLIKILHSYVKDSLVLVVTAFLLINIHYFWTFGIVSVDIPLEGYGILHEKYCMFHVPLLSGQKAVDQEIAAAWSLMYSTIADTFPLILVLCLSAYGMKLRLCINANEHLETYKKTMVSHIQEKWKVKDRLELYYLDRQVVHEFIFHVYPYLGIIFLICVAPFYIMRHVEKYISTDITSTPCWSLVLNILSQIHNMFYAMKIILFVVKITCC